MKEQDLQLYCQYSHAFIPVAIGIKAGTKEGEGTEFIITCLLVDIN
jgi:hypothetical protein